MNRDYQLSIRIPTTVYGLLRAEADHERRSVADIINIMLEDRYPEVRRMAPTPKVKRVGK